MEFLFALITQLRFTDCWSSYYLLVDMQQRSSQGYYKALYNILVPTHGRPFNLQILLKVYYILLNNIFFSIFLHICVNLVEYRA